MLTVGEPSSARWAWIALASIVQVKPPRPPPKIGQILLRGAISLLNKGFSTYTVFSFFP